MNNIKMIVTDVDGTLYDNDRGIIEPYTLKKLQEAHDKGVVLTISSGRSPMAAFDMYGQTKLPHDGYVCSMNGGAIFKANNIKDPIYTTKFTKKQINSLIKLHEETKLEHTVTIFYGLDNTVIPTSDLIYQNSSWDYVRKTDLITISDTDVKTLKRGGFDIIKALVIHDSCGKIDEFHHLMGKLKNLDDGLLISGGGQGKNVFAEINPPGSSKGLALDHLAQLHGIDVDEMLVIGDWLNDISMLERAKYSVTLNTSTEEVKKASKYIIDARPSEIVGKAIEKFIL